MFELGALSEYRTLELWDPAETWPGWLCLNVLINPHGQKLWKGQDFRDYPWLLHDALVYQGYMTFDHLPGVPQAAIRLRPKKVIFFSFCWVWEGKNGNRALAKKKEINNSSYSAYGWLETGYGLLDEKSRRNLRLVNTKVEKSPEMGLRGRGNKATLIYHVVIPRCRHLTWTTLICDLSSASTQNLLTWISDDVHQMVSLPLIFSFFVTNLVIDFVWV